MEHLYRSIDVGVEFCVPIVKVYCKLHNYVGEEEGMHFMDTTCKCTLEIVPPYGVPGNVSGINIRDYFASHLTSPQGVALWQYEKSERSFQNLLHPKQFSELYMVTMF
jgi:hypothetical protein